PKGRDEVDDLVPTLRLGTRFIRRLASVVGGTSRKVHSHAQRGNEKLCQDSAMQLRATLTVWLRRLFAKKSLGQRGEAEAARFLKRQGYLILARGRRLRPGELDLVVLDGRTIVFVEVKTRVSQEVGHPAEAVDENKQRRLTRLAVTFLKRHG